MNLKLRDPNKVSEFRQDRGVMDENSYPSNQQREVPTSIKDEDPKAKKLEKITVVGTVERRKKPLGRKLKEMFVGGDAQTVGQFIFMDVIVPAIRDLVADAISQGVERMIYGESRSSTRTRSRTGGSGLGYTNYTGYSARTPPWDRSARREETTRLPMGRRARATHNFDEITLDSRVEAEQILDRMVNVIDKYGQITVGDLYEILDLPADFTDEKYGWTQLPGAGVTRTRNGRYLLDLPQPEPLS